MVPRASVTCSATMSMRPRMKVSAEVSSSREKVGNVNIPLIFIYQNCTALTTIDVFLRMYGLRIFYQRPASGTYKQMGRTARS